MSLGFKEIINFMRGEMPQNIGFGEMPEKEFFDNALSETFRPSKDLVASLNLNNKKASDFIEKMEENKMPEDGKDNLSDKIRQELRALPKIDSENHQDIAKQVIDKLGIRSEEDKNIIEAKVGVRANISRNLERIKILDKEGQEKVFRDFALEDSKWMQKIGDYIKSINKDKTISSAEKEIKINNIWREMKEIHNDYKIYYEDFEAECKKYGYEFKNNKQGILGHVGADELFNIANNYLKKNNAGEINIIPATLEQDVDDKTDFFIEIKYKSGNTLIIPCQIKAPNFNEKTDSYLGDHLITSVLKSSHSEVEKIEKFRKGALKKYNRGLYITIPYGEALETTKSKKSGKKKSKVVTLLADDGTAADDTKKRFLMEIGGALSLDILNDSDIINKLKTSEKGNKKKGGK